MRGRSGLVLIVAAMAWTAPAGPAGRARAEEPGRQEDLATARLPADLNGFAGQVRGTVVRKLSADAAGRKYLDFKVAEVLKVHERSVALDAGGKVLVGRTVHLVPGLERVDGKWQPMAEQLAALEKLEAGEELVPEISNSNPKYNGKSGFFVVQKLLKEESAKPAGEAPRKAEPAKPDPRPAPLPPAPGAAAERVLEVEGLALKNAEVRERPDAGGGKAVLFGDEAASAETEVQLPAGKYAVVVYAQAPDSDRDAFYLVVAGDEQRSYPRKYGRLAPCVPMEIEVKEPAKVKVQLRGDEESTLYLDRVVIRPAGAVAAAAVAELAGAQGLAAAAPAARARAAESLGRVVPEAAGGAAAALAKALADPDAGVRMSAALSLAEIGAAVKPVAPELVAALVKALADPDRAVRSSAAEALGALGPEAKSAADALEKAKQDQDEDVRDNAEEALDKVKG